MEQTLPAPGGVVKAKRREPCEVCTRMKEPGSWLQVWDPTGEERAEHKKVFVHPSCRRRLLAGERPDGVKRRGLTHAQLLAIVVLCETQLGCFTYQRPETPRRLLKRELRAFRMKHVFKLEPLTASNPELLSERNLLLAIEYHHRYGLPINEPFDLVTTLRALKARDKMHRLIPPPEHDEYDF